LARQVIVNFAYRQADNQSFIEMAQIRARLRHANLIPIYDLGVTKDYSPYFTEPFIQATELSRLLNSGADKATDITLSRLISYLLDVCQAIAFLHANGFLHLLLSPGKVLLSQGSHEVFVECGHHSLAPVAMASDSQDAERSDVILRPMGHSAPEQLDLQRFGPPGIRTDVYRLGGILYEILYDNPPNGSRGMSSSELLQALAARRGPPPRRPLSTWAVLDQKTARKLEPVCLRALEYEPTARQADVATFAREIEECGRHQSRW
jgi:serine/threonine protein kinase